MQSVFYQLIEDQIKNKMLAEVQDEFVFKIVDPAVIPEEKSKPKRALICILGFMLGGMLGVAFVLVRMAFKKDKSPA
jgi:LPS O-antigen subunit length determinant protein (WzzB/FepE family)